MVRNWEIPFRVERTSIRPYPQDVDALVIVYRLFAIGIVVFWIVQIAIAARQPPEWQPPRAETFPIRITRDRYILGGALGIIAGVAVLALSFVLFP
jgi:hypothetical protein